MDKGLEERLLEVLWHLEQGETFETRGEAVKAIEAAFVACGWTKPE